MPAAASDPLSSNLQTRTLRSFAPSLVLLWMLGVSLLCIRHLSSLLALRRLQRVGTMPCPPEWQARIKSLAVRMGLRREVLVRLSTRVDVPLTFGVLKSYILLPLSTLMGLTTEQLEALIAHELAHIRQHDSLINAFQICAETLLFYHPTVWWLSAQMRVAREQRCDDLAVQIIGDHALYARALLTMEELRAPIPHLALRATGGNSHMSKHHLTQRIQRVLGAHGPEKRAPWTAGALALCMASIGLATLWPVHAHSAPHPAEAKRTDGQQTVTTNTQGSWSLGLGTSVNGKSIGVKIDSKTVDLPPEYPITVDGQQKRFGDMSADEQYLISMIVEDARKGAEQRFGNPSADTPQTPVTVNGQPNVQKPVNEAVAPSKNASLSKVLGWKQSSTTDDVAFITRSNAPFSGQVLGWKQSSTADNGQHLTATAVRQKVHQLKVNNQTVHHLKKVGNQTVHHLKKVNNQTVHHLKKVGNG
jgi:beta-lactamase regulating signal transducer with metallopeptidase domain